MQGAILDLYGAAAGLCKKISQVRLHLTQAADDSRMPKVESLRRKFLLLNGILGVHGLQNLSPELARFISPEASDSTEYRRNYVTLEDVFRTLGSALGKTPNELQFRSFVSTLNIGELKGTQRIIDSDIEGLVNASRGIDREKRGCESPSRLKVLKNHKHKRATPVPGSTTRVDNHSRLQSTSVALGQNPPAGTASA